MNNRTAFLWLLLFLTSPFLYAKKACIIVHGTWASQESWYRSGGSFFEAVLATSARHGVDEVVSFTWSGKNSDRERRKAAVALSAIIEKYDDVVIIAHSHGANVAIMASQMIDNDSAWNYNRHQLYKISKFYALGVPVQAYECFPNMNVINYFYNLFSFEDFVQPVFGIFGRTFFIHERVANISAFIDNQQPDHSGLHHPIIGKSILNIHENLMHCGCSINKNCGCFDRNHFAFKQPIKIFFHTVECHNLICKADHERENLLKKDQKLMRLLLDAIMRKPKNRRN